MGGGYRAQEGCSAGCWMQHCCQQELPYSKTQGPSLSLQDSLLDSRKREQNTQAGMGEMCFLKQHDRAFFSVLVSQLFQGGQLCSCCYRFREQKGSECWGKWMQRCSVGTVSSCVSAAPSLSVGCPVLRGWVVWNCVCGGIKQQKGCVLPSVG